MLDFDAIKKRFENHKLTEVLYTPETKIYEFKYENTNHLKQRWILDKGTLIVQGDCWDSIYRWNDTRISLGFIANCSLPYFVSTCVADKDGHEQMVYNEEFAEEYMKKIACDYMYENNEDEFRNIDDWNSFSLEKKLELVKPIFERELGVYYDTDSMFYFERESDAFDFLNDPANKFMFGNDGWEWADGLREFTPTPYLHLAAIKVAKDKHPLFFNK